MMNKQEPYPAEDAWYTPKYFAMPAPPPYGGSTDLQTNGPHQYFHKTLIAKASSGVTKEMVFEALRRHATPGRPRDVPVSTDNFTDIDLIRWLDPDGIGWLRPDRVKHHVFPEHLTVVNTTVKGMHRLHPGNVSRTVVQEGDDIYVVTHGLGTGSKYYPLAGPQTGVELLWQDVDEGIRDEFTPTTFNRRWRAISERPRFPDPTFNQRWDAIPDPVLRTARSWLDLSQNPAYGNLSPAPSPSETPQRQEGRRLQDIDVVGPQDQGLPPVLPLSRSAPPWLNLESTPSGGFRRPVLPNAPADVWKDAFVSPAMPGHFFPIRTMVVADNGAPALDAPDGRGPIAQSATLDPMALVPMKRLVDLGRPYLSSPSDDPAGGLGKYDYRGFSDDDGFRRR